MLFKLQHHTVVPFLGVYYKDEQVHLVMDLYAGGDLKMQCELHRQRRSNAVQPLPMPLVQVLAAKILRAACWLHSQSIVFRDFKAANFLLDVSMFEPVFNMVLADFSTACLHRPGQRLSEPSGSPDHWAPEVWTRDYGMPVDSWAIGIMLVKLIWYPLPDLSCGRAADDSCPLCDQTDEDCKERFGRAGRPKSMVGRPQDQAAIDEYLERVRAKYPEEFRRTRGEDMPGELSELLHWLLSLDEGTRWTVFRASQQPFLVDDDRNDDDPVSAVVHFEGRQVDHTNCGCDLDELGIMTMAAGAVRQELTELTMASSDLNLEKQWIALKNTFGVE